MKTRSEHVKELLSPWFVMRDDIFAITDDDMVIIEKLVKQATNGPWPREALDALTVFFHPEAEIRDAARERLAEAHSKRVLQ